LVDSTLLFTVVMQTVTHGCKICHYQVRSFCHSRKAYDTSLWIKSIVRTSLCMANEEFHHFTWSLFEWD